MRRKSHASFGLGAAGKGPATRRAPRQRPTSAIWHNFAQAVGKEVAVHSGCWANASRVRKLDGGKITTLARWHQVHDLLDAGVGLLECARRLNLALNTVKRYARIEAPAQMRRAPQYRPTLVDPYREYLRKRRAEDPAVLVLQLLREIRERGYTGSQNLLYRYITQGRVEDDRPAISPRSSPDCCSRARTRSGLTSRNSSTRPPAPAHR